MTTELTYLALTLILALVQIFLPNPARWRDAEELIIRPAFFVRTLRDGLVFLAALPVMEGIEHLQSSGLIGFPISLF